MARRKTVTIASLGSAQTLAWGSTYYLPAILATPIARELGVPISEVFAAFSAALVTAALLGPPVGRHIDRFGGRGVLLISNVLCAAGLLILGVAQNTGMFWAAWLIIGAGMAMGLYEAAFSTLAVVYGSQARSAITGITLIAGLASTICWPISAWLEAETSWRTVCWVWAAAHVLIGVPLNLHATVGATVKEDCARKLSSDAPRAADAPAQRSGAMVLLAFVFATTWFTSTAMATHLPQVLRDAGATPGGALLAASLVGPAQVVGRLLEFGLLNRMAPLLSARMAAAAHPAGALLMLGVGAPAGMVFAALHGMGNGVLTIAKGVLPLTIFGPSGYGQRQGILMIPARFAQAGAPLLFALLLDRFGSAALVLTTSLGMAATAALFTLSQPVEVQST